MEAGQGIVWKEIKDSDSRIRKVCKYCEGFIPSPRIGKDYCDHQCKDAYHKYAHKVGDAKLQSKGIRYANLSESPRLQRLLKFLSDCKPHTTREIINGANICAVNTAVTELRRNNFDISCKFKEVLEDGSRVYEYQLSKYAC